MNPKSVNDLDPKLKETYERVMGTSLPGNPATSPAPTMQIQPVTSPPIAPAPEPQPSPQPEVPIPSSSEDSTVSQVFRADNKDNKNDSTETATVSSPSSENKKAAKTSGKKLLPIIVVCVAIFFAAYAILWAKLLGLF
ncbi:MAG: hypothetical protein ABSE17_04370 [Candidatus Levyibacteriota bacterium]|jgi:hypothetical protein